MPAGTTFCRSCEMQHGRPVGRNCKRQKVSTAAAIAPSVPGPLNPTGTATQEEVNYQILTKLTTLHQRFDSLDEKVRDTERAVADRITHQSQQQSEILTH